MTVAVRVIPCLDVDGGRVVKGVNFRALRDAGDPDGQRLRLYSASPTFGISGWKQRRRLGCGS